MPFLLTLNLYSRNLTARYENVFSFGDFHNQGLYPWTSLRALASGSHYYRPTDEYCWTSVSLVTGIRNMTWCRLIA